LPAMTDASVLRGKLLEALPVVRRPLVIRLCERSDLDALSGWPPYPEPYDVFSFSFARLSNAELDSFHSSGRERKDRITLVADLDSARAIGYLSLIGIDWESRRCVNMGIRVHPDWCGQCIGSRMLTAVRDWWFVGSMSCLRLDVAGSNTRARSCYEKAGFSKIGEFWREAPDLRGKDLTEPKWRFLARHVRAVSSTPEVRFLLMELRSDK